MKIQISSRHLPLQLLSLCAPLGLACQSALAAPDKIYTPRVGSAERNAILTAMRPKVKSYGYKSGIVFTGVKMRVSGDWAYVDAETVNRSGKPIGPEFTNEIAALLRRTNRKWRAVQVDYATDVISLGWEKDYPQVPRRLWPHQR